MNIEDGTQQVLKIGNKIDLNGVAYYMAYFDGIDIIYCFLPDNLPWATIKPLDIVSSLVFATYFYDIKTLTVEADGHETLAFISEGDDKDNFTATLNGEDVDLEVFKSLYQYLIQTQAEEIYLEDPAEEDLICKVSITRNDEFDDETVEFYQGEDKTVIIKHNGVTSFINKVHYD